MMENNADLQRSQQLFAAVLDGNIDNQAFISILNPNSRVTGKAAVDIYRNNSIGTRLRALESIYPVIKKILGEQCFKGLAYRFVTASPSYDADLNVYGGAFPSFLSKFIGQQDAFTGFPYLPDLARLEWFFHAAYYAKDDPPYSVSEFSVIDTSVFLFQSHALYSISTAYPLYAIWQGNQTEERVKEVNAVDGNEYILISRQQGHPRVEKISSKNWRIIQLVEGGIELEALADLAVERDLELQTRLPAMIEQGWLVLYQDS